MDTVMRDIDLVIQLIAGTYPAVKVRQLKVSHPGADDDGIWFFERPEGDLEVQVESSTGMCPFLIETDESDDRFAVGTVKQTVEIVARLLHLP